MQILCQICQRKPASNTCINCGAQVCNSDYDKASGLCVKCRQGKQIKR